jgi:hypothetical protein
MTQYEETRGVEPLTRGGVEEVRRHPASRAELALVATIDSLRSDLEKLTETCKDRKKIRILFDGPPGPESGRFIEVEDEEGKSFNAGPWTEEDGVWVLTIPWPTNEGSEAHP